MAGGGGARNHICRCESVSEADIVAAMETGARTINDIKRQTRAGMGACQGIYCVAPMIELLQRRTGLDRTTIAPMTARPPVRAIEIGLLADHGE